MNVEAFDSNLAARSIEVLDEPGQFETRGVGDEIGHFDGEDARAENQDRTHAPPVQTVSWAVRPYLVFQ